MHWLLIGYMFLFIHRPFEIYPILGDMHFERVYILGVMVYWVIYPGKRWLPNPQHLAYGAFACAVLFCWALSPWMDVGQVVVENWFKIVVFYVLFVTTIHDEKRLRLMVMGFLFVMGVYMTHSLKEYLGGRHTYRMGIVRMLGVDTSLGDPNSFGASIVFALPFVSVFWATEKARWFRLGLAGYVCLSAGCILLTGSRSSLIGLLVWGTLQTWQSPNRWRWFVLGAAACPVAFLALPESLQTRFETIINPEVGPKNAQISGEGRLEGLQRGTELIAANPLSGCGPGAWRPATRSKLESHNLYGQVMGETGLMGVSTFLLILGCFWANLRWMARIRRERPEWRGDLVFRVASAVALALFLMLFEGNFGHNLFRHNWLWYGGFLIIARHCVEMRLATVRAAVAPVRWVGRPAARPVGA